MYNTALYGSTIAVETWMINLDVIFNVLFLHSQFVQYSQHGLVHHHLRRRIDGESELGLLAVVDGEALHQEGGKAGTWTETLMMVRSCGGDVYNEEEEEQKLDDGENDSAGTRPETLMRVVG